MLRATHNLSGPWEPVSKPFIFKATAFCKDLTRENHIYLVWTENQGWSSHSNQSTCSHRQRGAFPFSPVVYILFSSITSISSNKKKFIYPQFQFGNTNCDSIEKNHISQFIHRHKSFLPTDYWAEQRTVASLLR